MADIFLSYAREDIKKAELLANALESQGWSVFWDRTSLLAGQDFETVIEQAIKQAGCMVVAWSEASRQSDWVRGEAGIARERNILVPILFEPVEPPIAFRTLHTENLTDWDGEIDAPDFLKLCKAINEYIKPGIAASKSSKPPNNVSINALNSTKTFSLKRLLRNMWDWLSVIKHLQTLAVIVSALALAIVGGWQVYLQISEKSSLKMELTEVSNFVGIQGNWKNTYTVAGLKDSIPVYGRGQRLFLTLINDSTIPLDVVSLNVRLLSHNINYPPTLKYSKLTLSLPGTRLPIEEIKAPIRWESSDQPGTSKRVGEGIIRLSPKGTSEDKHQIKFTVEASSPGLWEYQVEADYSEPKIDRRKSAILGEKFIILLRGL